MDLTAIVEPEPDSHCSIPIYDLICLIYDLIEQKILCRILYLYKAHFNN